MSDNTPAGPADTSVFPPAGWSHFGTHIGYAGPLEFSEEHDDAGNPLWERARTTRSMLIALAAMLDKARLTANANDATAQDPGVYGDISRALRGTLELVTGDTREAESVYALLVNDGMTVAEALARTAGTNH